MKVSKKFTTVTTFSKLVALSMLVVLPILGFWLGYKYGKMAGMEEVRVFAVQK